MKYAIAVERTPNNYAAYSPDLPGCAATADKREEVLQLMRDAIRLHIEGLREEGESVPKSKLFNRTEVP